MKVGPSPYPSPTPWMGQAQQFLAQGRKHMSPLQASSSRQLLIPDTGLKGRQRVNDLGLSAWNSHLACSGNSSQALGDFGASQLTVPRLRLEPDLLRSREL